MTQPSSNTSGDVNTTREAEFRALEKLPTGIRRAIAASPVDFAVIRVYQAWLESSLNGFTVDMFLRHFKSQVDETVKRKVMETYGPEHPQA